MTYGTAPVISVTSAAVVVLLYVTIRPSGLHVLVYCWFPLAGGAAMCLLLGTTYDAVIVKRLADQVAAGLNGMRCQEFFQRLQKEQQMEMLR